MIEKLPVGAGLTAIVTTLNQVIDKLNELEQRLDRRDDYEAEQRDRHGYR